MPLPGNRKGEPSEVDAHGVLYGEAAQWALEAAQWARFGGGHVLVTAVTQAHVAARYARHGRRLVEADDALPQCRMARVLWPRHASAALAALAFGALASCTLFVLPRGLGGAALGRRLGGHDSGSGLGCSCAAVAVFINDLMINILLPRRCVASAAHHGVVVAVEDAEVEAEVVAAEAGAGAGAGAVVVFEFVAAALVAASVL